MDTILVTGATGFVGTVLLPKLSKAFPHAIVVGLSNSQEKKSSSTQLTYQRCDLADKNAVTQLIHTIKPNYVINLAAISHIPTAFNNPDLTWNVNLYGTLNLLNALTEMNTSCVFLQVGSGDCYGQSFADGHPVDESTHFMPMNPYSASKAAADLAAFSYRHQGQLKVIRARPFNHSGAGQSDNFVIPAFAKQIARIERGLQIAEITVGDLTAERCFLHVNDVVAAYIGLLINHDKIPSGEAFNIVSDEPVIIKSILDGLLSKSEQTISIMNDPDKQRPSDIFRAKGNADKIKKMTHWSPTTTLDDLLEDVLNHFRKDGLDDE
jgi:GDP-4-dehydro-6-deoxy-D-mannose reductase